LRSSLDRVVVVHTLSLSTFCKCYDNSRYFFVNHSCFLIHTKIVLAALPIAYLKFINVILPLFQIILWLFRYIAFTIYLETVYYLSA